MNKNLLTILAFLTFGYSFAQDGIEIHVDGVGSDVSGTIVSQTLDPSTELPIDIHLIVTNNTGSDQQWRITVVRLNVPGDWSDVICWPPLCYIPNADSYVTPEGNAPTIVNGTSTTAQGSSAEIKPGFTPGIAPSSAEYMYYITDTTGIFVDSVQLNFDFIADIKEVKQDVTISIAPNPSSDYFVVNTKNADNGTMKIVDVLGNIISEEKMTASSNKINVSNYRNGVYFVIIDSENAKPVTRRIIVRH